jgi:hypothetical protein
MSIKRSKAKSTGTGRRPDEREGFFFDEPKDDGPEKTWEELVSGQSDESFVPYLMANRYHRGALIAHPKFGHGAVVKAESTNMEVVFAEGKKKLGHGIG